MKKYSVVAYCEYIDDSSVVIETNDPKVAQRVADRHNWLLKGVAETKVVINQ